MKNDITDKIMNEVISERVREFALKKVNGALETDDSIEVLIAKQVKQVVASETFKSFVKKHVEDNLKDYVLNNVEEIIDNLSESTFIRPITSMIKKTITKKFENVKL